jgi:hypothetical protein
MTWQPTAHWPIWVAVALALIAVAWFLGSAATRLDRLHRRVEGATVALDDQLLRRAQAATELAVSGLLDPASAVLLHQAAVEATDAGRQRATQVALDPFSANRLAQYDFVREHAESDLSRTLRAVLDELPDGHPALLDRQELADLCFRVRLARRFHNDAVTAALTVRRKRIVRWARLAGRAPLPRTVEIDDEPPRRLHSVTVPGGS